MTYFDPKADSRAWPTVFPPCAVWRLIQTRPGCERRVADALRQHRADIDAYVPLETVWRRSPRRKVPHPRPLIPGYVFAELRDFDLPAIHVIDGATRVVRVTGRTVMVDPVFVARLRREEGDGRFDKTRIARKAQAEHRKPGDRVRVTRGPFDGFIGMVQRLQGARRVQVLLALFGRPVTIDLAEVELVVVDASEAA